MAAPSPRKRITNAKPPLSVSERRTTLPPPPSPSPDAISPKLFDTVSQFSHFGWGLAVAWAGFVLGGMPWAYGAAGAWTVYSAVKEFWYDQRYETPIVRGSNLKDFAFQVLGAAVALGALLLKGLR